MSPYRTPGPTTQPLPAADDRGGPIVALLGIALIVAAVCCARLERDPLAELPAEERIDLLERTRANLELCRRHDDPGLRGFCDAQAAIGRALPECDADCRALAHGRYPTRSPSARP